MEVAGAVVVFSGVVVVDVVFVVFVIVVVAYMHRRTYSVRRNIFHHQAGTGGHTGGI